MVSRKSVFQRVGFRLLSCWIVGLLLGAVAAWAQQSAGLSISPADLEAGRRLYGERIRPVLETQCLMCHQGPKSQGGLDVASREGLLKGGQSGPAVVPGNASASLLYKLVAHQQQPAMPYKMAKLTEAQIASIAEWINKGVPDEDSAGGAKGAAQVVAAVSSPAGQQLFEQVRPVLEQQCLLCHGGKFKQAGLNLLTRETLLKGSDTGAVVVPGKAEASLLIKKIRHEHDPGMPHQKPKLAEEVIARIIEWVNAGVPYERPLELPASSELSHRPGSEHWAFQAPKRTAVPKVKNAAWVR
ncbi:MAG: c-type cytochrome, partial [Acidobacteria bacterium]|nr:c-type cytochrome [Acidobacteriota bacterium]